MDYCFSDNLFLHKTIKYPKNLYCLWLTIDKRCYESILLDWKAHLVTCGVIRSCEIFLKCQNQKIVYNFERKHNFDQRHKITLDPIFEIQFWYFITFFQFRLPFGLIQQKVIFTCIFCFLIYQQQHSDAYDVWLMLVGLVPYNSITFHNYSHFN